MSSASSDIWRGRWDFSRFQLKRGVFEFGSGLSRFCNVGLTAVRYGIRWQRATVCNPCVRRNKMDLNIIAVRVLHICVLVASGVSLSMVIRAGWIRLRLALSTHLWPAAAPVFSVSVMSAEPLLLDTPATLFWVTPSFYSRHSKSQWPTYLVTKESHSRLLSIGYHIELCWRNLLALISTRLRWFPVGINRLFEVKLFWDDRFLLNVVKRFRPIRTQPFLPSDPILRWLPLCHDCVYWSSLSPSLFTPLSRNH